MTTPTPTPTKLVLRLLAVVLGSTAALTLPSVAFNLLDRQCRPDELLSPAWLQTRDWSLWFPLVAIGAGGFWLWKETFPQLGQATRPKVIAVAAALVVQLLAIAGALGLFLTLHRNWAFPPPMPSMSVNSVDGKRTAHVLYQCYGPCRWELYVQQSNAWKMQLVGEPLSADGNVPLVEWDENGQPRLRSDPTPVRYPSQANP